MNHQQINRATEFLKYCQKVAQKTNLTSSKVYGLLEDFEISSYNISSNAYMSPLKYFSDWYDYFKNKKNIIPYSWGDYWSGFDNGTRTDSFIKIYISLDRNHLLEGVKQIFDFIAKENIQHTSKSTSIVRTDNVIIRLHPNDLEGLEKITQFVNNNKYLQEGMNKINPFLPTVGKIGVMFDDGRSYNEDLASLISYYIRQHIYDEDMSFSGFAQFVSVNKKNDPVFLNTFNQAFFEKGKYQKAIEGTITPSIDVPKINTPMEINEKVLRLAVVTSFDKYGKNQATAAIANALNDEYGYFSEYTYDILGNKVLLREYLKRNLTPVMLKRYILKANDLSETLTPEEAIINYVNHIIYETKGCVFEDALYATANKFSDTKSFLMTRIKEYATHAKGEMFTTNNPDVRKDFNFRQSVLNNIKPERVYSVVDSILYNKGINYFNKSIEERIECCADIILERIYSKKH